MINADGNMAALRQHEREQDRLAELDRMQEEAEQELADDLFDAYMTNNYAVIDEVDDSLRGVDTLDNLLKRLRDNWTADGMALRAAYMRVIAAVCEDIAKGTDDIEKFRREYDL